MGVVIYGLVDPLANELRYVGQTHFDLAHRLKGHIGRARRPQRKSPVVCWLRKVLERSDAPEIFEIESCEVDDEADAAEEFYIQYFRMIGCRLTNHAMGGRVNRGFKHSAEWLAVASAKRKGVSGLSNKGMRRTPEQKAKISAATKAAWTRHPHPQKGRNHLVETKEKIRASLMARVEPIQESTRKSLSAASMRNWQDPDYRLKAIKTGTRHPFYGKGLPGRTLEAARIATSLRHKGVPKSEQQKQRTRASMLAFHAARRAAKSEQDAKIQPGLVE